jgi:hypothetical protein
VLITMMLVRHAEVFRGRSALRRSFVLNPRPSERGTSTGRLSGRRGAALGVVLGGLAALWGSFEPWGTCPDTACGEERLAFFVLVDKTGVDFGLGVVTALLGLALAIIGIAAFRQGGASPWRTPSVVLALAALLTVGAFVVRMYVLPEFLLYGPGTGVYLVAAGAVMAATAGVRVRKAA